MKVAYSNKNCVVKQLQAIDWDFPSSNRQDGIHNIHPYPGKFIPEIPRNLLGILDVPKDRVILDPFCGSGVTLTEAQDAGYSAVGIDVNPIGCLISRVKTTRFPNNLMEVGQRIVATANESRSNDVPEIPNLGHWFNEDVVQVVARLVTAINREPDEKINDCLRLALSSILVRVSKQESDTRYAAVEKQIKGRDVLTIFLGSVQRLCKVLKDRDPATTATILRKDILQLQSNEVPSNIGAVITSPPYPNAYEYWLYHKYRMFWLGYDPKPVKEKEIGARAHYFKKTSPTPDHFLVQLRQIFQLFSEMIAESGYVCMVVGRSKIHGKIIDNAAFVEKAAIENGFEKVAVVQRKISNSRKSFNLSHAAISHEHILIFQH